jgi:adenylate cyclase
MLFRELDLVRVKGKHEPVAIYEPVRLKAAAIEPEINEINTFADILKAYRHQQWDTAEQGLRELLSRTERRLYHIYMERIGAFRSRPPPPGWDGVYTFETK